ncbi:MAG: DMT family transporter [Eubacterium sp.]|nr:DMT family transporter [Eubacterium sp.]
MKKNLLTFAGALICCLLWGSAIPSIKLGYELWNIEGNDTWTIIAFAGIRFFLAGVLVILISSIIKRKFLLPRLKEIKDIFILSLFQTIGQYIFFYLGLAHTSGVNTAVVDSLTTFFAIIMASLVFKMEKLTGRKLLGCALGFTGVLVINLSGGEYHINLLGDLLVAMSALCYGVSSVLIKKYSKEHDTVLFSGYQFMMGGLVMVIVSMFGGQKIISKTALSPAYFDGQAYKAVLILLYLSLISSVAYTLWGILLRTNDVSKISIFGFMTPIFGVILSAILLGEGLGLKYLIALLFIGLGIITVNYQKNLDHSTD